MATTPSWMTYKAPTNTEPMTGALFEGGTWKLVPSRFLAPNSVSMGPNMEGVDYAGYLAWEEQQQQQQQQQQLYEAYSQAFQKAGNTAASYTPSQGQPPKWEDFYNQFDQAHRAQFGIGLDRPWTSDLGAINQKALIDKQFLDALDKYNQTFGTQLQPNEQYLGPAAQPNTYTPKRNRGGGLSGVVDSAMGVLGGITDPVMKSVGSVINPVAEASGKAMGSIQGALDPVYNVGEATIGSHTYGPGILLAPAMPAIGASISNSMGAAGATAVGGAKTAGEAAVTAGGSGGAATMADLVPAGSQVLNTAPGALYAGAPIVEAGFPATAPLAGDSGLAGIVNQTPGLLNSASAISPMATGMLAGGLLGAAGSKGIGSGGGDMATTVTRNDPNPYVAQYLPDYLRRANELSNEPYQPYPGEMVAGFSPYQQEALNRIGELSRSNPLYQTGARTIQDTAAGKYLSADTNPYLQGTINKALGDVRGMMGSTFGGDAFGSSAHQELMQRRGLESIAPVLMGQYNQERGYQMDASRLAPSYAQARFQDANTLLNAGALQQQQAQNVIDANLGQWQEKRDWPRTNLNYLGGALNTAGGIGGGTTSQTGPNPYARNRLASGLGAAATMGGLLNMTGNMGSSWAMPAIAGAGLLGYM